MGAKIFQKKPQKIKRFIMFEFKKLLKELLRNNVFYYLQEFLSCDCVNVVVIGMNDVIFDSSYAYFENF